jgi:hypothetical protein
VIRVNLTTVLAHASGEWIASANASPTLGLHASAKLREHLLAEIKELGSGEDAAKWVHQNLSAKNRLRASDATQVEALFAARLAKVATSSVQEPQERMPAPGELAKLPIEVGSTRVNSASLSRVAFATESTSAQSPRSPVSFVGAAPRTLIICVSPKAALYHAR